MTNDEITQLVVVLGMHRSGTSAISGAIDSLGMKFGNNLYGPREDNPAGFWENEAIVKFNDKLLAEMGMRWDSPGLIDDTQWDDGVWETWMHEAGDVLQQEFYGALSHGLKDPRISKLLGFWNKVFQNGHYKVRYVVALRNPLEVMASLNKRDAFDALKSQLLWLEHTLAALQATDAKDRVIISYNDLMDNPEIIIDKLSRFLGLTADVQEAEGRKSATTLRKEYRHTTFSEDDYKNHPNALAMAVELYLLALDYSRSPAASSKEFSEGLKRVEEMYLASAYLVAKYMELVDKLIVLNWRASLLRLVDHFRKIYLLRHRVVMAVRRVLTSK